MSQEQVPGPKLSWAHASERASDKYTTSVVIYNMRLVIIISLADKSPGYFVTVQLPDPCQGWVLTRVYYATLDIAKAKAYSVAERVRYSMGT